MDNNQIRVSCKLIYKYTYGKLYFPAGFQQSVTQSIFTIVHDEQKNLSKICSMRIVNVQNTSRGDSRKLSAEYCDGFLCRFKGLMFRKLLQEKTGLLLVNKSDSRLEAAIHMLFVFMDLGIIWINSNYEVVDKSLARAWHLFYQPSRPAQFTLEVNPAELGYFNVGDKVEFINV